MARLLLGVTGGIAAYKIPFVLRGLVKAGHDVRVLPTPACLKMVGAPTWEALASHPIATDVFAEAASVSHVTGGRDVELAVVAPASAQTLAKLAAGFADNLLTATLLGCEAPLLVFPAMHTAMWTNAATQANVATLRERGVLVHDPVSGDLSSGDRGAGRLPEPSAILAAIEAQLRAGKTLTGRRVVITAGGTREPLDPVRFLGNRSTGTFGCALAEAARRAGASVTLIAANVERALYPADVEVVEASSCAAMEAALTSHAPGADAVIMAAAVADYRPAAVSTTKIKKEGGRAEALTLDLVANPDLLRGLVAARRDGQVIVGFAAETGDSRSVLELGQEKARRKGADLLAINRVGEDAGFGAVDTEVMLVDREGALHDTFRGSKAEVATRLIEALTVRLPS